MAGELAGLRVLIPRGGELGERLAAAVEARGGTPTIAPVIRFDEPADARPIAAACERLTAGDFDWLAVTSATTVGVLAHHQVRIPNATRVAAVGPATRDALVAAGFRVDFIPVSTYSAEAMVAEWPDHGGRVLIPQSAIAEATLADGLTALGLEVTAITAYRTTALDWADDIIHRVNAGGVDAVLLTSASIARAVAAHCTLLPDAPLPGGTIVACIGESTATGARHAGLPVHLVAGESTAEAMVEALSRYVAGETVQPSDLR